MIRLLLLFALIGSCRGSAPPMADQQKELERWATGKFGSSVGVVQNTAGDHAIVKQIISGAGHQKQTLHFWVVRVSDKAEIAAGQFAQGLIEWRSNTVVAYLPVTSQSKVATEPELTLIDIKKQN